MGKVTEDLIDRLAATAVDCRTLIRQMHEQEQSLRLATRDARQTMADMREALTEQVHRDVAALIDAQVKLQLDLFGDETRKAMAATARKISAEFDTLTEPMLKTLGLLEVAVERHDKRAP